MRNLNPFTFIHGGMSRWAMLVSKLKRQKVEFVKIPISKENT